MSERLPTGVGGRNRLFQRGQQHGYTGQEPEWIDNDRDRRIYLAGYAAGQKERKHESTAERLV